MNVKNEDFFEFFRRNVWWIQIKSLPLHHQNNINNKDNEKVHRKSNPMVEVTDATKYEKK